MSEPLYPVGHVARLLNMPQQTVRYFDNTGLVVPYKAGALHGGKRRYSVYDIYRISTRQQYKNMGFSLDDARSIMNACTLEQIENKVGMAEDELERDVRMAELRLAGCRKFRERLSRIHLYGGRCFFMKRPACWRHIHLTNGIFADDENSIRARSVAMDIMPLATYMFRFSLNDLANKSETGEYIWYLSIESPYAEQAGLDMIPGTEAVPEELCAYTVVNLGKTRAITPQMLSGAMDFVHANGMRIRGDVLGNSIISARDGNGDIIRYFEAWLPVQEA